MSGRKSKKYIWYPKIGFTHDQSEKINDLIVLIDKDFTAFARDAIMFHAIYHAKFSKKKSVEAIRIIIKGVDFLIASNDDPEARSEYLKVRELLEHFVFMFKPPIT